MEGTIRPTSSPRNVVVNDSQPIVASTSAATDMESKPVPMDVDEDGSSSRATVAHCKKCNTQFGEFFNNWRRVTGSYYLPSLVGSYGIAGLNARGKPKPASHDSALDGCVIQPLVCNACNDTLGIVCTGAPESKRAYADRDFFKLPKIQLNSDATGHPVDAIIEDDRVQPQGRDHSRDRSVPSRMEPLDDTAGSAGTSRISLRRGHTPPAASLLPSSKVHEESRRHDHIPSRPSLTHTLPQKAIVQDHEAVHAPPPNRNQQHHERVVPLASPVNGQGPFPVNGVPASVSYPSNLVVKLEAVDRMQTQMNLNRATLESCTRDISRIENAMVQMQQTFDNNFNALRAELIASRQEVAAAAAYGGQTGDRLDDQTLEVFSSQLTSVANKANEVDTLKVQVEMIKRKIKRLEETQGGSGQGGAPYSTHSGHTRDHSIHQTPINQQAMSPTLQRQTPPTRPEGRPHQSHPMQQHYNPHHQSSEYRPDQAHQLHPLDTDAASSGGWVSVNPSAKRGHPNGIDGRSVEGTPIGSPKRPKLAPLEPRQAYESASSGHRLSADESTSQSQSHSQSFRRESVDSSYPDSTSRANFIPYTAEAPPDESWRPESQRVVSGLAHSNSLSPGRGRGRGRGRGGRPRKSLPTELHTQLGTPEWEKETWTGSQVGPDGYYHPGRGGLVRRGSGGAHGRPSMPLSPGSTSGDPYSHTKKTRTKPIRNQDGVLIRKDGRPDMRSQSSAANLRKVHARKEEEKLMGGPHEPSSGLVNATVVSAEGQSPDSQQSHETETTSTQEKTHHILRRMFPNGVSEHEGRLYTAEQYFPRSSSHTPLELKTSISRSDASVETGRGSRGSSDGGGDQRMEDRHVVEEKQKEVVERPPTAEAPAKTPAEAQIPAVQSRPIEARGPISVSSATMSSPTLSAPTTATMTSATMTGAVSQEA